MNEFLLWLLLLADVILKTADTLALHRFQHLDRPLLREVQRKRPPLSLDKVLRKALALGTERSVQRSSITGACRRRCAWTPKIRMLTTTY